jgi:hypothetical protein
MEYLCSEWVNFTLPQRIGACEDKLLVECAQIFQARLVWIDMAVIFDGKKRSCKWLLEAEPEHQDYLERYPNGYICHSSGRIGNCRGRQISGNRYLLLWTGAQEAPIQGAFRGFAKQAYSWP